MSAAGDVHELVSPSVGDGVAMWRIASASQVLDVNSRYAYLLWCRDFAATSVVARRDDDQVVGFVTGYLRPDEPRTLVVWQVAVSAEARGCGLAGRLLDALDERVRPDALETTVTADNAPSIALFGGFAKRRAAPMSCTELFGTAELGDDHDPENLHRIGPIPRG